MKPSFRKQLLAEIDKIHSETGSTGPEGYAILRRIANGADREKMLWGFKEFKKTMDKCREEYCRGDHEAAFSAVVVHIRTFSDLPLPEWLANFLVGGAHRFTRYEAASLDEAFHFIRKPGFHVKAARKRQQIGYLVWWGCHELNASGRPIDDNLFDEVGEKFGIGKTKAKEYFYQFKTREAARTK
jgi:hypothetical protein